MAELANHKAISEGNLETAFKVITEKAANALEVERVSVWLFNSDDDDRLRQRTKLQCISLYERSNQKHSAGLERDRADYSIYFKSLTSARIIAVTDTRTDLRIQELWDEFLETKILYP